MDIEAILREIDAEIEKLNAVRAVIATLEKPYTPKRIRHSKPNRREAPVPLVTVPSLPAITVLPPKRKREYHRSYKPLPQEPRALSSGVPDKPVFVPLAKITQRNIPTSKAVDFDPERMEAALRHSLLGGAA